MPKILVADDSRFQAQLLVTALQAKGHTVLVAQDTVQAGMLALRELPDAIVLDVNMPGGSGIEVLKRLRRSVKTRNIPIIIVSGSCDSDVANVAMELGAARFLHKPVDTEQLCETLNWVLSNKAGPSTLPQATVMKTPVPSSTAPGPQSPALPLAEPRT